MVDEVKSGSSSGGALGAAFLVFLAVLAGAAVAIAVWGGTQPEPGGVSTSTGPTAPAPGTVASASGDLDSSAPAPATAESAVSACARELVAADAVIAAARIGAGHWAEHVQARTDLLAGTKPKAEASAIWKRTRQAGPADLQRYDGALAVLARFSGACSAVSAAASEPEVAAACKRRAQVMAGALAAARAAMGDWRSHQAAMAAHKAGDFDAAHAQTLWVAAWTAAPTNLNAFKAADVRLSSTPPCDS